MVRSDLSRGLQAAQCVHAAGESSPGNIPHGTHAVVLTVPTEDALWAVAARLRLAGVSFVEVVEDVPPHAGELMALGLVPARKREVGRFVSSLPLLK